MKHVVVEQFSELYDTLPLRVRKFADHNFSIIKEYPDHPLLRLLKVEGIWSMRIGSRYRALAVEDKDTIIWFWIGKHKHYTTLFLQ
ncbi:MAG: hypothetical protein WDA22_02855 [Bacteroidota bacterium]